MNTQPPSIRKISGTQPGLLDSTQLSRILRSPKSSLTFASYDARAASIVPDIQRLSLDEEYHKPKRIVLEKLEDGSLIWRFVPKARLGPGVKSEGRWPRAIRICDEWIECSEDQWDIYKLDPKYDCYVPAEPDPTTITTVQAPLATPPQSTAATNGKRALSPEPAPSNQSEASGSRRRVQVPIFDVDAEEEAKMMVDESEGNKHMSDRARKLREAIQKDRQDRRDRLARRDQQLANGQNVFPQQPLFQASGSNKRKVAGPSRFSRATESPERTSAHPDEEDSDSGEPSTSFSSKRPKRARTTSPTSAKRDLEAKRLERERRKKVKLEKKLAEWRQTKQDRLMKDVYNEFSTSDTQNGHNIPPQPPDLPDLPDEPELDEADEDLMEEEIQDAETALREAQLAESRRKLAELEADRPLWEAAARQRLAREQAEAEAIKREQEAKRAQAAAERRRAEQEAAERERQARQRERAKEEAARRERKRQQQRFSQGVWTSHRALERYKTLCDSFDTVKFSAAQPLTFEDIPWPVLKPPFSFSVEDVDWSAVEDFFRAIKPHMRWQDYKVLVEKSHRRFHPDRWRSRGLLVCIANEEERGCIEVASNCVAQALTPIWKSTKERP